MTFSAVVALFTLAAGAQEPGAASLQSAYNPSVGVAIDALSRSKDSKGNFSFRSAELNLGASIDPFAKGWLIVNGGSDEVEVEEAALRTTSLPWNLTLTGGRQFATFGRMGHFHDHELHTIDRPFSLDTYLDGETKADGVEVGLLSPTDLYLHVTVGAYNRVGGDNERTANDAQRSLGEFTYLGRLVGSLEFGDDHSLELGVSELYTPERAGFDDSWRRVSGVDATYRFHPASGGIYSGAIVGAELLNNDELRFDELTLLPTARRSAWGGYVFGEFKAGRHLRPGVLFDRSEDLDAPDNVRMTKTVYLTWNPTDFQRIRAQYSRVSWSAASGMNDSDLVGLQWTGIFGYHVHGFRDR